MDRQLARARGLGFAATGCAAIAALLLVAAIPLNERAVDMEDRVTGDSASYAAGFAVLIALVAGALAMRFALRPFRGRAVAAILLAIGGMLSAAAAGFVVALEPIATQLAVCVDGREAWLAAYTGPTPNGCGGYLVPSAEYHYFDAAADTSWGAGGLFIVGVVLLAVAAAQPLPTSTRTFSSGRARVYRLVASACAGLAAVVVLIEIVVTGLDVLTFNYFAAFALVLLAIAAATGFRSAARPETPGVSAPITLASIATAFAVLTVTSGGASNFIKLFVWVLVATLGIACLVLMALGRHEAPAISSQAPGH